MDFVSESLSDGRRIRMLTLIDEYTRDCLAIEVDTSINGVRVSNVLSRIALVKGFPGIIRVDNGPEFISKALDSIGGALRLSSREIVAEGFAGEFLQSPGLICLCF